MWWSKTKARQTTTGGHSQATPMIMSLEPRMLFDGAVAATVADVAQADSHATAADAAKAPTTEHAGTGSETHAQTDAPVTPAPVAVPGETVVFVDARVKDSAELLKGVAPGTQVVQLDASKDGLQQIADYLSSHQGVSSVQIIAHGNSGDLWLGSTYLSADNVAARSDVLAQIGQDMNVGGDILIYACNTAEGDKGINFVDSLAQLTGRDIAASTNRTGAGGDWTLEIATGSIESHTALSYQGMSAYQYSLVTLTVTTTADSGAGSLRDYLASANAGDTITFQSKGMVVDLDTRLVITKNVTIEGDLDLDGVADVTLSGQYKTQVLQVNQGVTALLDGLVITKGLAAGNGGDGGAETTAAMGGGIVNAGNLTLRNVTVTANAASGGGGGGGVAGANVGSGGGGGGGIGGQNGGNGGSGGANTYVGGDGSANQGGNGGSYNPAMGGQGGSNVGGQGAIGSYGYTDGGAGGTATSGTLSIGGGGGGSGWDAKGGNGAAATGGIYNASTGTLTIVGNSVISNNIAAGGGGGGGGGGSTAGSADAPGTDDPGGDGGKAVGAIWNKGTLLITASNVLAMTGNVASSGAGGKGVLGATTLGATPDAENLIYNDGGTLDLAYVQTPSATIVVASPGQHLGTTSTVTITFNQAVIGFDNSDLTVPNGTLSTVTTSDGGITWTATFTPDSSVTSATNQITLNNSGVADTAGIAGSGISSSNNYSVDTLRPTATIVVADNSLTVGETSLVTITFSEGVTGFDNADLILANGTLSDVISGDGGITWTATFTPTSNITDTTNLITLNNSGVVDLAGNSGSGTTDSNNYAIDTQRPTATIVVADATLLAGETAAVTITFSEPVTGFSNADLAVANGQLTPVTSSDGGITWTAIFTPTTGVRSATNLISLVNTQIFDLAGNAGSGATHSGNYSVDTVLPTATIVVADNSLAIGETSLVTITFSEAVTGFDNADLTLANGTLSDVISGDGGITWTATFTPTSNITDTSNVISLDKTGVVNLSGNAGSGTTDSNNYAVDTARPTATIVVADTALGAGQTTLVTITFSEPVSGLSNAGLNVVNGTLSTVSSADGGITWTATFTPTAGITDTSNLITLNNTTVTDQAGNAGSGTTDSNNYSIDNQRPTATIVMNDSDLRPGETALVTITFSEAVTGFDNSDLSVANGTLSVVSSSDGGVTWTATFTPTVGVTDATNLIVLNNTGIFDLAGNTGTGTTSSANYVVNTQVPTATIVVADPQLTVGETTTVTITFNQAVTGFTNDDLSFANGTLSTVATSDGGVTWTATLTPTSNVTDTSNLIVLDNTGVTNASGNSGVGTTDSNNYAIDTQRPTATISVADATLGIGQTTTVTITFSEAVNGFDLSDLSVANGSLSNLVSSDGGVTWTATLTPTAAITDPTNLVVLDTSQVSDAAGNAGASIAISNNYALDADLPTATVSIANPNLTVGQTTVVTITFSEIVSGFDLDDLSVANGTLSNLATSDGGKTWTATLTPTANLNNPSNLITLDTSRVTDTAGNAGSGFANSSNYAINTIALTGDPLFLVTAPAAPAGAPDVPLQPIIFGRPTGDLGSPVGFPALFEQRDSGGGLPPIGNIFIRNNALAPSFIAQVFSTDGATGGGASGFLGFGGGDGGVFGSSTLSSLFNRENHSDDSALKAFDSKSIKGNGGAMGALTLGQQLQQINDKQQRQVIDLAQALQQVGINEMQA